MASTYLSKTLGTPTDNKKWTFSAWCKRSALDVTSTLMSSGSSAVDAISMASNGKFNYVVAAGNSGQLTTNRLFQDVSGWYHIVVAVDTTQGTAANRVKIYINGVQETSFSTSTYPSQNFNTKINSAVLHTIGGYSSGSSGDFWNGSMTHIHFIDGLQYAPTVFGEVDSTSGIWKAKTSVSATYGNNGFFLKMENSGAMGTDSSGKSNNFTVNGTLTQNIDSPDNNFATMNPLDNYHQNQTFTQGNNTVKSDNPSPVKSTLGVSSGKWYIEAKALSVVGSGSDYQIGIISSQVVGTQELGHYSNDYSYYGASGSYRNNDSFTSYGNSYTAGDIIGVAIDLDNNKLYFSKNGTFQNSGDPTSGSTGTGAISITTPSSTELGAYFLGVGGNANSNKYNWNANFGNGKFGTTAVSSAGTNASGNGIFEYDVPTGYTALSTKGLNS